MPKEALIVIDPQNDFCPGGKLAVNNGDHIINPTNVLLASFRQRGEPVIITRDWHRPDNTAHMGPGRWPLHCIQQTIGAEFHPRLNLSHALIISKGMSNTDDGYSAFEGLTDHGLPLDSLLRGQGINQLVIAGLATDYCVKASVLDARRLGYSVRVAIDAIAAVNLKPDDGAKAIQEMQQSGAVFATSDIILRGI